MKRKMFLIFTLIAIIALVTTVLVLSFKFIDSSNSNNEKIEENLSNISNNENKGDSVTTEEKRDLTNTEADTLNLRGSDYLFKLDFLEANKYFYEAMEDKKFNESQSDLKIKYQETAILANFYDLREREEFDMIKELIRTLTDTDVFFASVMWLDTENRKPFIASSESINPVFYDGMTVLDKRIVTENEVEDIKGVSKVFKNLEEIHEYRFEIEGNILLAYVIKNNDKLYVYKITEEIKGSTPYSTIREWDDFLSNVKSRKDESINEEVLEILEFEEGVEEDEDND